MLPRLRYRKHGFMVNAADQNQKKCDSCQKLFPTQQGLDSHQSRPQNKGCHRLQTLNKREAVQAKIGERKENKNYFTTTMIDIALTKTRQEKKPFMYKDTIYGRLWFRYKLNQVQTEENVLSYDFQRVLSRVPVV